MQNKDTYLVSQGFKVFSKSTNFISVLLILDKGLNLKLNGKHIFFEYRSVVLTGSISELEILSHKKKDEIESYIFQINALECGIDLSDLYLNNILIDYFDNHYILNLEEHETYTQIEGTLHEIKKENNIEKLLNSKMIKLLTERFFIKFLRYYEIENPKTIESFSRNLIIVEFVKLVNIHFRSHKKLQQYADMLNISKYTLSNIFSQSRLDTTPSKIIKNKLIKEAKTLITNNPKISGKEVAFNLGFNNPNNFFVMFKQNMGISFTEYSRICND